ncbi:MAG: flavodoxin domain-containing protein [Candidatus Limnocylindrales bacterium]
MAPQILIATASRHGSTFDIADEIARVLSRRGCVVLDKAADETDGVERFDAVVCGSAVYMGRWLPEANAFVTRNADELAQRPVWLFSSGPIGEPPQPEGDPQGVAQLIERVGARGHRTFAGRLDRDRLSLAERVIVGMLRAPKGDFRDFPQVTAWATEIADELAPLGTDTTATDDTDTVRKALLLAASH